MTTVSRLAGRVILRALFATAAIALPTQTLAAPMVQANAPTFASDRLSVETMGAGPDVILIPGFASSRDVWRAEAERLKSTHRVHLVQFAGFAGEPWVHGGGPFVEPAVEALARYIREAGLRQPAVVGHSMGGLTALMLAQRHPQAAGRVMTVDSLPFFSALYGPQATAESAAPFAEQAARAILTPDPGAYRSGQERAAMGYSRMPATQAAMVEWSMQSDRQAMAAAIREVMTTDVRPGLAAMTTPVWALYAADADGGAPAAMADALWAREYERLPGVRLERVDGSRHFIMADQPERMAALMDAFLRSTP